MIKYSLPGFAELDLDQLDDYYDSQVDFKNHKVVLDLNFDEYSIDQQKLEIIKNIIDNLSLYDAKALSGIEEDYHSGGTVKFYIEQHTDIFDKEEIALSKLYLKRVGFYPENENQCAVFDYTIDEERTQYLIVVIFDKNGEINYLTMES